MSDTKRISDDELAYLNECRDAANIATLIRNRYASYLLRKYGISGRGRIQPDGTIEVIDTSANEHKNGELQNAGEQISQPQSPWNVRTNA